MGGIRQVGALCGGRARISGAGDRLDGFLARCSGHDHDFHGNTPRLSDAAGVAHSAQEHTQGTTQSRAMGGQRGRARTVRNATTTTDNTAVNTIVCKSLDEFFMGQRKHLLAHNLIAFIYINFTSLNNSIIR